MQNAEGNGGGGSKCITNWVKLLKTKGKKNLENNEQGRTHSKTNSLTNYVLRLLWETVHSQSAIKGDLLPDMEVHAFNLSSGETEARGSLWFWASLVHRGSSRTDNTEKPCLRARGGRGALMSYAILMNSMTTLLKYHLPWFDLWIKQAKNISSQHPYH